MRLLVVLGPPAVGKMAVGRELVRRTSFRMLHNHHVIEPLLEVFDHGTPAFATLVQEFRDRVVEEAAASGTDLLMTFVWAVELEEDADVVRRWVGTYERAGGQVAFLELVAPLATRLERNGTELRLAEKPSKRDLEWSDANLRELDAYVTTTDPSRRTPADGVLEGHAQLRLDTEHLTVEQVVEAALEWLAQV